MKIHFNPRSFDQTADDLITHERARQIVEEDFSATRDDSYSTGELSRAAYCYFHNNAAHWPWGIDWWKPGGVSPEDRVFCELRSYHAFQPVKALPLGANQCPRLREPMHMKQARDVARAVAHDGHR